MRFTNATIQLTNMVGYDLPQAVKEHHVGRAVGIFSAWAVGTMLTSVIRRKRLPKNPEEWMRDAAFGILDLALGLGRAITSGIEGRRGAVVDTPLTAVTDLTRAAVEGIQGDLSTKEILDVAATVAELAGQPVGAAEYVANTFYDFDEAVMRVDLRRMLGNLPRGEE